MGGALLQRAVSAYATPDTQTIYVVDPTAAPQTLPPHVRWVAKAQDIAGDFTPDLVILAVKPQQMAATLPAYRHYTTSLFLSIAAGITLDNLQHILRGDTSTTDYAIIRAMPNLPASVGYGITAMVAKEIITPAQRSLGDNFMRHVGQTVWLENENLMDAVTALSGSGPAYIFALGEAMSQAGESLGLPPQAAAQLARATIIGSAHLLEQSTDSAPQLRKAVTSPGGTTEAALTHLLNPTSGLFPLLRQSLEAAASRAAQLSSPKVL